MNFPQFISTFFFPLAGTLWWKFEIIWLYRSCPGVSWIKTASPNRVLWRRWQFSRLSFPKFSQYAWIPNLSSNSAWLRVVETALNHLLRKLVELPNPDEPLLSNDWEPSVLIVICFSLFFFSETFDQIIEGNLLPINGMSMSQPLLLLEHVEFLRKSGLKQLAEKIAEFQWEIAMK